MQQGPEFPDLRGRKGVLQGPSPIFGGQTAGALARNGFHRRLISAYLSCCGLKLSGQAPDSGGRYPEPASRFIGLVTCWASSHVNAEAKLREFVVKLISEGHAVLASEWQQSGNWLGGPPVHVELEIFQQWRSRCRLLLSLLGPHAKPWQPVLEPMVENNLGAAKSTQGALKAILQSLDEGLLVRFEDLVLANAFSDLYDQADYLFEQGYILAAGVIARAVLEERLRRLCAAHECSPDRDRPTISDYNTALYKCNTYDKITYKHVDSLAAIGNDASHNKPDLQPTDVRRLLDGLHTFLTRFST
jgi:hypothetical protein